jgi:hypothetical protein
MLRIVITSSAFEMSLGSTWRFVNLSGIWAAAEAACRTSAQPRRAGRLRGMLRKTSAARIGSVPCE